MKAVSFFDVSFAWKNGGPLCLKGCSFSLEEGRTAVLLGPNGSGKSTIMSLILGYNRPVSGRAELRGRPVESWPRKDLGPMIGYVAQTMGISFNYSVRDYLLLGRSSSLSLLQVPGNEDAGAVERVIAETDLDHLADRKVLDLSAGEKQLVAIARCLVQNPSLIMLDEPTSHLDPAHTLQVTRLISRLRDRGHTVLFSSHDPLMAHHCADEAILIREGEILKTGSSSEVLTADNLEKLYKIPFNTVNFKGRDVPIPDAGLWKE